MGLNYIYICSTVHDYKGGEQGPIVTDINLFKLIANEVMEGYWPIEHNGKSFELISTEYDTICNHFVNSCSEQLNKIYAGGGSIYTIKTLDLSDLSISDTEISKTDLEEAFEYIWSNYLEAEISKSK